MIICNQNDCCGCAACIDICKHDSICMVGDKKGFLFPQVDENKCVGCNLCINVCPVNHTKREQNATSTFTTSVHAAISRDKKILKKSSSGGVFYALAKNVIEHGGVVFGAKWDESMNVVHAFAEDLTSIHALLGSKYVQSNTIGIYADVKKQLKEGREVLFSGTPCQVSALNNFLSKKYDNLITVDVVCHGVPSPKVWNSYVEYIENKHNNKIISCQFRAKKPAWIASSSNYTFSDKTDFSESVFISPYFIGFVRNTFLRESCYRCHFSNPHRYSDITLCDYWGYTPSSLRTVSHNKSGISGIIVNSDKGKECLDTIKSNFRILENSNFNSLASSNLNLTSPQLKPQNSDDFWNMFMSGDVDWDVYRDIFFKPNNLNGNWKKKVVVDYIRVLAPSFLLKTIKRIMKR